MARRAAVLLMTLVSVVTAAPPAQAHWWGVGRYLGVGWGDGYHAKNAGPANHGIPNYPHGSPDVPWWAVPAESLPQPARRHEPQLPAGPSLFRQPGEGSSVIVPER